MKSSGIETRNTRANPRGNSGTSFPQSWVLQYWEAKSEDVVWTVVTVDDAGPAGAWASPPPVFEAVVSTQREVELESGADPVSVA